jgi:hypothetical protein
MANSLAELLEEWFDSNQELFPVDITIKDLAGERAVSDFLHVQTHLQYSRY